MPNARLSDRAPFIAEVDVVSAGLPAPRRVWGSDVSETGIFLQTTQMFRVGDRVSLRFDVEQSEVHVRAAEVMWVRPFEPVNVDGKLPGVGLKFVAIDPPARAALRRFVQPQLSDTQPEQASPAGSLPPQGSLPPITQGVSWSGMKTGKHLEVTDEMLAVSLPPFSQPPLNISLPEDEPFALPDEVRVFKNTKPFGSPKPVTIGPKQSSSPPTFLVGWTFRRDEEMAPVAPPPPADSLSPRTEARSDMRDAMNVTSDPPVRLDLRFDDVGPSAIRPLPQEPEIFDVTSAPPDAAMRDDETQPAPTLERELAEGRISVLHLPVGEERRSSPRQRAGQRAMPAAVALLCIGTVAGSALGLVGKRLHHAPAPTQASAAAPLMPLVPPALAEATVPSPVVPPAATAAPPEPAAAPVVAAKAIPAPVRTVVDAERDLLPRRPDPVVESPEALTDASVAVAVKPHKKAHAVLAKAEKTDGKTTRVKVGDAEVVKAFGLASPARVVVDLMGGKLPKTALEPGGGITRVRFGHPAKGTSRVVIELEGDAKPKNVEAAITDGTLTVSFR